MLTAAQLEIRKTGIGGSEIGAILGESRFASPFDVWLAKTQGWAVLETEDMRRGSFLEDGIARWYADRFAIPAGLLTECATLRHRLHANVLCTSDRLIQLPGGRERLLSIKAPRYGGGLWGNPGTDNVPGEYLLQLQWEHLIHSSHGVIDEEMHLAALLDGDLAVYILKADRQLQAWLLEDALRWWAKHVVGGEQPSLEGSSQAREWLKRKFAGQKDTPRDATPHEIRLCVELQMFEAEAAAAEKQAEDRRNDLKLSMGDASEIIAPNGAIRWRPNVKGIRSFKPQWNKGATP